jgi:hypothetical protein
MTDISNNPWAILAICVALSGFMICVGASISKIVGDPDNGLREQSDAQRLYMSEVRRLYIKMLENEV